MLDGFPPDQPSVESLVQRMNHELGAKAVVLLHENGQVIHRDGWVSDGDYPAMAALISAMIATGKSLGEMGENFPTSPSRFACDSESTGLYTVAVTDDIWVAVLYDQPLNPGQFRMKVRKYAELLARLGVNRPAQWEMSENGTEIGANMRPVSPGNTAPMDKITPAKSSLFGDITDDEIDEIFENARS